jgi:hypothetical protein
MVTAVSPWPAGVIQLGAKTLAGRGLAALAPYLIILVQLDERFRRIFITNEESNDDRQSKTRRPFGV